MATLEEVLTYSAFGHALKQSPSIANLGTKPFPKPEIPRRFIPDEQAPFHAVWHFDHDAATEPAVVKNLTCLSRGMGNGRMTVATAVTLEKATVKTAPSADGKQPSVDIDLPLTPLFVIQNAYLKKSSLKADSHFLYPLAAEIDLSMQVVFGYELPPDPSAGVLPIPKEQLNKDDFMPKPADPNAPKPSVGAGQVGKVVASRLRIIVCFSFVTAKERADFEPGELLGAGRVWPHVLIMANQDLNEAGAILKVERPADLTMDGGDHSKHAEMNFKIESSLFADSNIERRLLGFAPLPSPYWDDLFSATDPGVAPGTIRAVDPLEKGGVIKGAVQTLNFLEKSYSTVDLGRVARQGAYDNIHTAPTMKVSTAATHPGMFLDRIYMAPFCEHDCLHTHWRWAPHNTKRFSMGWSASSKDPRVPGVPYSQAGATMVPINQTVNLEITAPGSFRYDAKAIGKDGLDATAPIPAGTFSIFFHHGMAYAIQLDSIALKTLDGLIDTQAVTKGEPDLGATSALTSNAVRYWRLRWGGDDQLLSPDIVNERLKVIDRAKLLKRASP